MNTTTMAMNKTAALSDTETREAVRAVYGEVARGERIGCAPSCCDMTVDPAAVAQALGYDPVSLDGLPDGANLGLGCGNPQAIASMKPGETVVDLGSGGGIDCFLAAQKVGSEGRVIGVDMTADMVGRARKAAAENGFDRVDFRLGEIEHLPIADGVADVILSNCVINLSPDKPQVFREAARVLKVGGRLAISDIVALKPMTDALKGDIAALTGCISGASQISELTTALKAAGFHDIEISVKEESRAMIAEWFPGRGAEDIVGSATIQATKGAADCCAPTCCDGDA